MRKVISWRIFFILVGAGLISVICVFPYIVTLQQDTIKNIKQPVEILFLAQFLQSIVMFCVTVYLGLFFAGRIDFRLPVLEGIVARRDYMRPLKNILWHSMLLGFVTALIIYCTDSFFTMWGATITTHQSYAPIWQKLLAAVYGGITEEILMRLFLMSFFVWTGMKLSRRREPGRTVIWISIVTAAVLFGLGHLPVTASLTALTPLIVARAVVLNGIGGIVFGSLFWKKGLESAMIAHFVTDIVLLTLLPLFVS